MTPEQREEDRWSTMAHFSAAMTTARNADERVALAAAILDKFRDVPDQQPNRQDTAAYARFAGKSLLEALIKSEGAPVLAVDENVHSVATETVFNEWIDEWLPTHAQAT